MLTPIRQKRPKSSWNFGHTTPVDQGLKHAYTADEESYADAAIRESAKSWIVENKYLF